MGEKIPQVWLNLEKAILEYVFTTMDDIDISQLITT